MIESELVNPVTFLYIQGTVWSKVLRLCHYLKYEKLFTSGEYTNVTTLERLTTVVSGLHLDKFCIRIQSFGLISIYKTRWINHEKENKKKRQEKARKMEKKKRSNQFHVGDSISLTQFQFRSTSFHNIYFPFWRVGANNIQQIMIDQKLVTLSTPSSFEQYINTHAAL